MNGQSELTPKQDQTIAAGDTVGVYPRPLWESWMTFREAQRDETKQIRFTATALGFALLFYIFISAALPLVLERAAGAILPPQGVGIWTPPLVEQIIYFLTYVFTLLLPFGAYIALLGMPVKVAFPKGPTRWALGVGAIPVLFGIAVVGNYISQLALWLLGQAGYTSMAQMPMFSQDTAANILMIISYTVLPGLMEELVFRGVIMQSFRRFGDAFALLVSAALFALCHVNLPQMVAAFCIGLALGYVALKTGSLWIGMLFHMLYNGYALGAQWLYDQMTPEAFGFVMYVADGALFLMGLLCFAILYYGQKNLLSLHPPRTVLGSGGKLGALVTSIPFVVVLLLFCLLSAQTITRL